MSKFRDGLLGPTVILFAICFVITFSLAAVYNVTEPVIAAGEIAAANAVRTQVLPAGDTFTEVKAAMPEGVTAAYRADNGSGYVFTSEAKGYGGTVVWMVGVDADGSIIGINLFSHSETPGLGTKVGEPDYIAQYVGGSDPDAVDSISGATRTSNSLKNSLRQALEAYQIAKEVA